MGVRKKGPKWTEKLIQEYLTKGFLSYGTKKYEYCNMYTYKWESDYLCITKSDIAYECEIKISRGDFFNDAKKQQKHLIVEGSLSDVYERPNYFYYAVPDGLISEEEVPEHAGLIYVSEVFPYVKIVKQAPKLHGDKFNYSRANLTDKFYYNYLNYKAKYEENDISSLKSEIKRLNKDITEYDDMLSERQNEIDELNLEIKKLKLLLETKSTTHG